MALDLLDEVSRFKIKHRPNKTLMLRIGIHTGSCAAGHDYLEHSLSCVMISINTERTSSHIVTELVQMTSER
jgi:hypothetical protein